jgi:hypothetical protein
MYLSFKANKEREARDKVKVASFTCQSLFQHEMLHILQANLLEKLRHERQQVKAQKQEAKSGQAAVSCTISMPATF